jgi:hypothetical protein
MAALDMGQRQRIAAALIHRTQRAIFRERLGPKQFRRGKITPASPAAPNASQVSQLGVPHDAPFSPDHSSPGHCSILAASKQLIYAQTLRY